MTVGSDPSDPLAGSAVRELDLGPPGFEATILMTDGGSILWENTTDERIIHLGPWRMMGDVERWAEWPCSYEFERLEHFFSSGDPVPLTLHSKHQPFHERSRLEQTIAFDEPQRIRYTDANGIILHDGYIPVRYQFTSVESSLRFQSDVRNKQIVGYYDVDVVWSDAHPRTDRFGSVKGLGLMHRIKLWRDRCTGLHSLTIYANRMSPRTHQEFEVQWFDVELRQDAKGKQLKMQIRGSKRDGASDSSRRFSFNRIRPRVRSGHDSPSPLPNENLGEQLNVDFNYIGVKFTHSADYNGFIGAWAAAQQADNELSGMPPLSH
ncbi:hypothetical protein TD95_000329 [Thielaviopsis punctulata]|uniref:Uncharacterized protein n=1 Tax=Thielaviopsis punctulata TaxID=72032 RepID=A0A0F4Z6Q9_9PEZI|nr:hypothetical protein TD95_000329 [Thielaviopsis punctulata]